MKLQGIINMVHGAIDRNGDPIVKQALENVVIALEDAKREWQESGERNAKAKRVLIDKLGIVIDDNKALRNDVHRLEKHLYEPDQTINDSVVDALGYGGWQEWLSHSESSADELPIESSFYSQADAVRLQAQADDLQADAIRLQVQADDLQTKSDELQALLVETETQLKEVGEINSYLEGELTRVNKMFYEHSGRASDNAFAMTDKIAVLTKNVADLKEEKRILNAELVVSNGYRHVYPHKEEKLRRQYQTTRDLHEQLRASQAKVQDLEMTLDVCLELEDITDVHIHILENLQND